jgi:hypothetical protein
MMSFSYTLRQYLELRERRLERSKSTPPKRELEYIE